MLQRLWIGSAVVGLHPLYTGSRDGLYILGNWQKEEVNPSLYNIYFSAPVNVASPVWHQLLLNVKTQDCIYPCCPIYNLLYNDIVYIPVLSYYGSLSGLSGRHPELLRTDLQPQTPLTVSLSPTRLRIAYRPILFIYSYCNMAPLSPQPLREKQTTSSISSSFCNHICIQIHPRVIGPDHTPFSQNAVNPSPQ